VPAETCKSKKGKKKDEVHAEPYSKIFQDRRYSELRARGSLHRKEKKGERGAGCWLLKEKARSDLVERIKKKPNRLIPEAGNHARRTDRQP